MSSLGSSILCPTDLTPSGDRALDLAVDAARGGSEIHLLHVCVPELLLYPSSMTPGGLVLLTGLRVQQRADQARSHLERLAETAAARTESPVLVHVIHDTDPASVIVRVARELKVDSIVMVGSNLRGLSRWLAGSVSTYVLRHSAVPVLMLQAAAPWRAQKESHA